VQFCRKFYQCFVFGGNLLQPLVLLAFRLYWGWQFFITGKGKLLNHPDIAQYFASLNIPLPDLNAWFIGGLECVGGLLLLIGLASRPTAFLLTCSMTAAYFLDPEERAKVFNISNSPDDFLQADPFFFWLTAILVLSFGPGLLSADRFLGKFVFKKPHKNSLFSSKS